MTRGADWLGCCEGLARLTAPVVSAVMGAGAGYTGGVIRGVGGRWLFQADGCGGRTAE